MKICTNFLKNKKIISTIIVGATCIGSIIPNLVYAAEPNVYEVTSNAEIEVVVTYELGASFTVAIPKAIVLDAETKSAEYTVTVTGNIPSDAKIDVSPEDKIPEIDGINFYMTEQAINKKDDVVATVTQEETEWLSSEVTQMGTSKHGSITAPDLTPGKWQGMFIFNVNLINNNEGVHTHSYTESVAKEATCTENGEKTLLCECGNTKTEVIIAKGHNYVDGVCSECNEQEAGKEHIHSYTEAIEKNPSCTEKGTKSFTCDCGEVYTAEIDALGHSYENGVCVTCKDVAADHVHNYIEVVTKEATCSEAGEKTGTCACGAVTTIVIPIKEHSYENGVCVTCKDVAADHVHNYTEVVTKEATCIEVGEKTGTCACGAVTTIVIPVKEHSFVDGTCNECGEKQVVYAMLRSGASDEYGFLGSSSAYNNNDISVWLKRSNIKNLYITDSTEAADHYLSDNNCWDVSNEQNGSIIAWYEKHGSYVGMYNVYIAPKEEGVKLQAPTNAKNMFREMADAAYTQLDKIDFSKTKDMSYMLYGLSGDKNKEVYLNIDTSNATNIDFMLSYGSAKKISFGEKVDFSNVTSSNYLFYKQENLEEVVVPETLSVLGDYALQGNKKLVSFTGEGLHSIGEYCFYGCTALTSPNIGDNVENFYKGCFNFCTSLTSINIGNAVFFDSFCFKSCSSLKGDLVLPSTTKTINDCAFQLCTGLSSITIPDTVESMTKCPFKDVAHIYYTGPLTSTYENWGANALN